MSYMIKDVFSQIDKLSEKINKIYDIDPVIKLKIFSTNIELNGSCVVDYRNLDMYIELNIPDGLKMTPKNKTFLNVMIIHEYCHFIETRQLPWSKRTIAVKLYLKNFNEKTRDEQKTWRQTKKLAQILGMWNTDFYNIAKKCVYVSDLKYN